MSGYILGAESVVLCQHGGMTKPTQASMRVKIDGAPAVLLPTPFTVQGCPHPPPPAANGPCVTAQPSSGTTRVFSEGRPLLTGTSSAICAPTGTGWQIQQTQRRVKGQ